MKTATLDIYELFQAKGFGVSLYYKGATLHSFTGLDLQEITEKAIVYLENQKFTRLKVNGKIYNFKDFLMKGTA
jgi:hypothetical protein